MSGLGTTSLFHDLDVEVTPDAPIGAQTWYGVGGRADLLVRPKSVDALCTLVKRCHRSDVMLRIIGSGANLLVGDEGVGGIVIKLDQPAFRITKDNPTGAIDRMRVMAGADMAKTLNECVRRGLDGLTQMAGIPASIGGALRMNAGGAFGAIGDSVSRVTCVSRTGELVTYPGSELQFGYRCTNIPDPIIISAVFSMTETDPIKLRERVLEIFNYKKSTQPLAENSAGCTFKNPVDPISEETVPAGKLIDDAGLKGLTIGGASVSTRHANFVVTQPGATASNVIELLDVIKKRVYEHSGIELEREVVVWQRGEREKA